MSLAIGIDLGTSLSRVAIFTNEKVEVISNDEQKRFTPSYVAFKGNSDIMVGESAKIQSEINPSSSIFNLTRLIGRKFDDEQLKTNLSSWPFEVSNFNNFPRIKITYNKEKKNLRPEEIIAMILMNMKKIAETYLKKKISKAVIAVPTYFNSIQRKATIDAANIAGFNNIQIINSSTAVAIAYGFHSQLAFFKNVFIFDLGGGALSVSIVRMNNLNYKVVSSAGNSYLGGEDFDNRIVNHFVNLIKTKYKKDVSSDKLIIQKLKNACEHTKKMLTGCSKAHVQIEQLFDDINFDEILSRKEFEKLNADLFKSVIDVVKKCLVYSNIEKPLIDEIIICGGSSRIPKIQDLLLKFFNNKPLNKSMISGEATVYGAAVKASGFKKFDGEKIILEDISSFPIGIYQTIGREFLTSNIIDRNIEIPHKNNFLYTQKKNENNYCFEIHEGAEIFLSCTLKFDRISSSETFFRTLLISLFCIGDKEPTIYIQIRLDSNGIINFDVSGTSIKECRIENERRLTEEDIDEMKKFAETCRQNYEKRHKTDIAKNDLELYCSKVKNDLSENLSPQYEKIISKIDKIVQQSDDNNSDDEEIYKKYLEDVKNIVMSCNLSN